MLRGIATHQADIRCVQFTERLTFGCNQSFMSLKESDAFILACEIA